MTEKERKKVKSLSHVRLFVTPWTVAHQASPSMGFSRQECWSGLPFPSPIRSILRSWGKVLAPSPPSPDHLLEGHLEGLLPGEASHAPTSSSSTGSLGVDTIWAEDLSSSTQQVAGQPLAHSSCSINTYSMTELSKDWLNMERGERYREKPGN